MFENILGQKDIIQQLENSISMQKIPHAFLFHGNDYTGKLTTALEFARAISCSSKDAPWNCSCTSCKKHRLLENENTLILGDRYFYDEIAACAHSFCNASTTATNYLFYRAVQKLLRRFDKLIWDGNEDKYKAISQHLQDLKSLLYEIVPPVTNTNSQNVEAAVNKILEKTVQIISKTGLFSVNMEQIRKVSAWAHQTAVGSKKIIIIENAHTLNDSVKNSLLKILEEPPKDVYFILTTNQREAISPTLLSRMRSLAFHSRSSSTSALVLNKIFRENTMNLSSIEDFFLSFSETDITLLRNDAKLFFDLRLATVPTEDKLEGLLTISSHIQSKKSYKIFLNELTKLFRSTLEKSLSVQNPTHATELVTKAVGYLNKAYFENDQLNISTKLLLENLLFLFEELKV